MVEGTVLLILAALIPEAFSIYSSKHYQAKFRSVAFVAFVGCTGTPLVSNILYITQARGSAFHIQFFLPHVIVCPEVPSSRGIWGLEGDHGNPH